MAELTTLEGKLAKSLVINPLQDLIYPIAKRVETARSRTRDRLDPGEFHLEDLNEARTIFKELELDTVIAVSEDHEFLKRFDKEALEQQINALTIPPNLLAEYTNQRILKEFYLVSLILDCENSTRDLKFEQALERILKNNKKPLLLIDNLREDKNDLYAGLTFDIRKSRTYNMPSNMHRLISNMFLYSSKQPIVSSRKSSRLKSVFSGPPLDMLLTYLNKYPNDARCYLRLGQYFKNSSPNQALNYFEKGMEKDSTNPDLWLEIGFLLYNRKIDFENTLLLQDKEKSGNTFKSYVSKLLSTFKFPKIKYNDASELSTIIFGLFSDKENSLEEAIKGLENMLSRDPSQYDAKMLLLNSYMKRGLPEDRKNAYYLVLNLCDVGDDFTKYGALRSEKRDGPHSLRVSGGRDRVHRMIANKGNIPSDKVYKFFIQGSERSKTDPINEQRAMKTLFKISDKLVMPNSGRKYTVPSSAEILQCGDEKSPIILETPLIEGIPLSELFDNPESVNNAQLLKEVIDIYSSISYVAKDLLPQTKKPFIDFRKQFIGQFEQLEAFKISETEIAEYSASWQTILDEIKNTPAILENLCNVDYALSNVILMRKSKQLSLKPDIDELIKTGEKCVVDLNYDDREFRAYGNVMSALTNRSMRGSNLSDYKNVINHLANRWTANIMRYLWKDSVAELPFAEDDLIGNVRVTDSLKEHFDLPEDGLSKKLEEILKIELANHGFLLSYETIVKQKHPILYQIFDAAIKRNIDDSKSLEKTLCAWTKLFGNQVGADNFSYEGLQKNKLAWVVYYNMPLAASMMQCIFDDNYKKEVIELDKSLSRLKDIRNKVDERYKDKPEYNTRYSMMLAELQAESLKTNTSELEDEINYFELLINVYELLPQYVKYHFDIAKMFAQDLKEYYAAKNDLKNLSALDNFIELTQKYYGWGSKIIEEVKQL